MLGQRLKDLREEKGLTQEALGELVNLTKANISKYESGKLEPNIDTINFLASFFNVTVDYLLGRTEARNESFISICKENTLPYTTTLNEVQQNTNIKIIAEALASDPELSTFWTELAKRDDLQIMLKQINDLSPEAIRRVIRYIKMVEDEEAGES